MRSGLQLAPRPSPSGAGLESVFILQEVAFIALRPQLEHHLDNKLLLRSVSVPIAGSVSGGFMILTSIAIEHLTFVGHTGRQSLGSVVATEIGEEMMGCLARLIGSFEQ